jgi:hypothetical protein
LDVASTAVNIRHLVENGGSDDLHEIANPDCDLLYTPASDAGAGAGDAGPSDGGVVVVDASLPMSDASVSDASAGPVSDAGGAACIGFHYLPVGNWAGVIFQANDGAAAGGAGICVEEGAQSITFMARADRATEVKFGSTGPGVGTSEFWIPITTTWEQYSIALPAAYNTPEDGAWNLFSVVVVPAASAEANSAGEANIFVKDIQWSADAP